MDIYQELKSPPIFWGQLCSLQARVCGLAGEPEQGLAILDQVSKMPSQGYGRVLVVEFYQLRGDLLLALSPDHLSEAEAWYQQALEIAREMGAKTMALQAATRLTHLWSNTDKAEKGRQLLSEIYATFTEGFGTPDLIEARELLSRN
jgi:hypothetical protein